MESVLLPEQTSYSTENIISVLTSKCNSWFWIITYQLQLFHWVQTFLHLSSHTSHIQTHGGDWCCLVVLFKIVPSAILLLYTQHPPVGPEIMQPEHSSCSSYTFISFNSRCQYECVEHEICILISVIGCSWLYWLANLAAARTIEDTVHNWIQIHDFLSCNQGTCRYNIIHNLLAKHKNVPCSHFLAQWCCLGNSLYSSILWEVGLCPIPFTPAPNMFKKLPISLHSNSLKS